MPEFAEALRLARQAAGLTQADVASRAGMSVEGVSLLERGQRRPRASTISLLAEALDLSPEGRRSLLRAASQEDAAPASLPTWPGALLGHDRDLAAIADLLHVASGPVTLTGPGGVGKTRLAAAVAVSLGERRADGVRWVATGEKTDTAGWLAGVATAVGCDRVKSLEAILSFLADRDLLLVLDNADNDVEHSRRFVGALTERCPSVRVLATSRQRLRVRGERTYGVAALSAAGARELFLRSATRPSDLPVSAVEEDAVARICRLVDGLPLAIELVAARTDVVGIPELADALGHSLLGGAADGGEGLRDELVGAVVGWTFAELEPGHRRLFADLSVFAGTFRDVDAQAVSGLSIGQVREGLAALLARSLLVRAQTSDGSVLFRLLHLVRSVAAALLDERDDAAAVVRRHAVHVLDVVERAQEQIGGRRTQQTLRALDRMSGDIDRALDWSGEHEPGLALRLSGDLADWCYLHGRYAQGRAWAERALRATHGRAEPGDRAPTLGLLGGLAFLQCDYDIALEALTEAERLFVGAGDAAGEARTLRALGSIARERGDYATAVQRHLRVVEFARAAGDSTLVCAQYTLIALARWLSGDLDGATESNLTAEAIAADLEPGEPVIWCHLNRGVIARLQGRLGEADASLAVAFDLSEQQGFPEGVAWAINQRGVIARVRGDLVRARRCQIAALSEHRRLGDRWREASTLEELALLDATEGDVENAALHLGQADTIRRQIGAPVPPVERDVRDRVVALLTPM